MASYVAAWCNNQIKLSTKVTNPGKQFSNGYLFGELLIAIDWLDAGEWGKMTNNSTTHARLSNFAIVDACLKSKGVFYDNNLIPLIVTEARGAAADLLLKIKRCKEVHEQPPPKVVEKSTHTVRPKEFIRAPMTQWGADDFLVKTMEEVGTHNFNKLDEAIHLKSFHDTQRLQEKNQTHKEGEEKTVNEEAVRVRISEKIKLERDRAAFMHAWIEEGQKSWAVNDDIRIEREKQRLRYELTLIARADARRENDRLKHVNEGESNVNDFERNMKRLGVGNDDADSSNYRSSSESGLNYLSRIEQKIEGSNLKASANFETMEVLKQTEKINKRARKERETRRRKMIVDQNKAQSELHKREAHDMMMEGLAISAREMREVNERAWVGKKEKAMLNNRKMNNLEEKADRRTEEADGLLQDFFKKSQIENKKDHKMLEKKQRQEEIDLLKVNAKKKKRVTATSVSEAAIAKLIDAVEVLCTERETVGGPVAPQFYRDILRCFVSNQSFYEDENLEEVDDFNMFEESVGYAEGLKLHSGLPDKMEYGEGTVVGRIAPSVAHSTLAKSCLAGICRDNLAVSDYINWTLHEFASFLRRDASSWDGPCTYYGDIIRSMPAHDQTDLEEIEAMIDNLEEKLGDLSEQRGDASRDVCDGSGGRANDWAADVCNNRRNSFAELVKSLVGVGEEKINHLEKAKMEFVQENERKEREKGEEEERLRLEEEETARLEAEEREEGGGGEPSVVSASVAEVDLAAEAKALGLKLEEYELQLAEEKAEAEREVERARMEVEEEEAKIVEVERKRQVDLGKRCDENVARAETFVGGDDWLNASGGEELGRLFGKGKRSIDEFKLEGDNVGAYNSSCVLLETVQLMERVSDRLCCFERFVSGEVDSLCLRLDAMCKRRSKTENDAIEKLAGEIGAAAGRGWEGGCNFAIDVEEDMRNLHKDALFPGRVLDARGNGVMLDFVKVLAEKFKGNGKGKGVVGVVGFVKVFKRVLDTFNNNEKSFRVLDWCKGERITELGMKLANEVNGKIAWKKFIHSLICCNLPTVCSLEKLISMRLGGESKGGKVGLGGAGKKPLCVGMSRVDFMGMEFWFEDRTNPNREGEGEGEREREREREREGAVAWVEEGIAKEIKEIYASMFTESDDSVNFSEFLLCVSCDGAKNGGVESNENFPMGFYRACMSIGDREKDNSLVIGRDKCGPSVTKEQLDMILNLGEEAGDPMLSKTLFEQAVVVEGGNGGGGNRGGGVKFSSLLQTEQSEKLQGLNTLADVFA